jgi:hypothetical protein
VLIKQFNKIHCPCCNNYSVTANKTPQPIEKSIASPGLLAQVATHKYCDALPLYRQTQMFKRFKVELDRTSLANWMIKCGVLIQPLINLMCERARESSLFHCKRLAKYTSLLITILDKLIPSIQSESIYEITQQQRINISYVTWASEYIPCPPELDFVPTIKVPGIASYAADHTTLWTVRGGAADRKYFRNPLVIA